MNAHHERRTEEEERAMIDRVADAAAARAAFAGAEEALRRFGDLTPWDLSTKEGREAARATISHADILREGCAKTKSIAGGTFVTTAVGSLALAAVYLAWSIVFPHLKPPQ